MYNQIIYKSSHETRNKKRLLNIKKNEIID